MPDSIAASEVERSIKGWSFPRGTCRGAASVLEDRYAVLARYIRPVEKRKIPSLL